jgi:hypothetical protein
MRAYKSFLRTIGLAAANPGKRCWVMLPNFKLAQFEFREAVEVLRPLAKLYDPRRLTITLRNGSEITFKSAENAESLRGCHVDAFEISGYIRDEVLDVCRMMADEWL